MAVIFTKRENGGASRHHSLFWGFMQLFFGKRLTGSRFAEKGN